MANAYDISIALTAETRHPVWGKLFRKVIAGELTPEDILFARTIRRPHPDWVGAVAGGNIAYLEAVAEVALTDFIATVMMLVNDEDRGFASNRSIQ